MAGADMDVWGLSEVVSTSAFNTLVSGMPGYTGLANDPIVPNGPQYYSDFSNAEQKVALVWRSSMATLVSAKVILTNQNSNFAGRPPVEYTLRGTSTAPPATSSSSSCTPRPVPPRTRGTPSTPR